MANAMDRSTPHCAPACQPWGQTTQRSRSTQVESQGVGVSPAHPGPDRGEAQALVGGDPVTAVEAPELAIHLQHIDGLLLPFTGDGLHQGDHLGLIEAALQGAANGGEGKGGQTHDDDKSKA